MRINTLLRYLIVSFIVFFTSVNAWATYSGTGTFTKITSLTDLTDGYYVVAYGTTFAMSNTNAGSYFGNTAITPTNNVITNPDVAIVWSINTHVDGGRTIYNESSAKYVSYTGSSNAAYAVASVTGGSERWTFAYTSSLFTITNISSSTRLLQYNSSNPRFACYTTSSSQANITLYKLDQATCTASNLAFATPSYSKIVGAASFTQTATSLNQTTAVTYSSSNPAVASVNSTTGEVTIAGAGSATITATQAAGTHNAVSYCAATATYTIDVASNAPTITVTDVTVPELTATVGNSDTETINISGVNLSENITLSLTGTNADQFSLSTYSVSQTAGTAANTLVVISYIPTTAGTHTATMTCASAGATTVTRTLNGTSSWASLSTPVATEATAISDTGFTANWNAVSGATSYSLDVKKVTVSNNGSTSKLSENFAGFSSGTTTTPGSEITTTLDTYTQSAGWIGTKVFPAGGIVKLGSSSALGNITTPSIDLSADGGSFTLSFKAVAWSGDATSVKVYLNNTLVQTVTGLSNDGSTLKTFTLNLTGGTSTSKIKIEGLQASSSRFFLDDVAITQSGLSTSEVAIDGSPFTVTENSKTFTGLTPGSTYKYSVIASNEHVTSTASNVVSVTTSGSTGLFPVFGSKDLQISVVDGKLLVNATVNQKIVLYNVAGQKVYEQRAAEGINTITVPVSGMYIVSVGAKSAKVIL